MINTEAELINDDTLKGFATFLGIKINELSKEQIHTSLDMKPEFTNQFGTPHGGVLATMLDEVTGLAAGLYSGKRLVTRSADIHYLKSSTDTHLDAYAHVVSCGKTMCLAVGELRDSSGLLLATGSFEFFFV